MAERRFDEEEAGKIFERASRSEVVPHEPSTDPSGFTLRELQEIGAEVGLSPQAISEAAMTLGAGARTSRATMLGVPLGVQHTVPLGRHLTETDWERLVTRLRQTFNARGQTEVVGGLRDWWNGNLRVGLERTEEGDVLHMSTLKGSAAETMATGVIMAGLALVFAVILTLAGIMTRDPKVIMIPLFLGGSGGALVAGNLLTLAPWRRQRMEQFDAIARSLLQSGDAQADHPAPALEDDSPTAIEDQPQAGGLPPAPRTGKDPGTDG